MSRKISAKTGAIVSLLLGALCIAFAPIFVRLSELGPSATAFYRLLFSLPVVWIWMGLERKNGCLNSRPVRWQDYLLLSLAGLFFACDLAIWDIERPAELVYRMGFNPLHARVWSGL